MKTCENKVILKSPPEKVFAVVCDNTDFKWRGDLDRIEITGEQTFTEYTADGHSTDFTVTECVPCTRYAFSMENPLFEGTWQGNFAPLPGGGTALTICETLTFKSPVMDALSHLLLPLKKIQVQYAEDLKKKLGE